MKVYANKITALLLSVLLLSGTVACNNVNQGQNPDDVTNPSASQNFDESNPTNSGSSNEGSEADVSALIGKLDAVIGTADDEMMSNITEEVPQEAWPNIVYTNYVEGAKAVVSQPMMSSIAHMVVLAHFPEGTDMQAVAEDMRNNMDPRRWLCVEPEKCAVETNGNYALLVMSTEGMVDSVVENFKNMAQ